MKSCHDRRMSSEEKQSSIRNIVKDVVNNILTPAEVELDEIKEEVWQDLSSLYYKYEDEPEKGLPRGNV